MINIFGLIQFLHRNFMLASGLALLTGTCWIAVALAFALFRDTIEPSAFAAHAASHQATDHAVQDDYYWFRQRRLEPYATPTIHAQNN